jgi:hypothetical protein
VLIADGVEGPNPLSSHCLPYCTPYCSLPHAPTLPSLCGLAAQRAVPRVKTRLARPGRCAREQVMTLQMLEEAFNKCAADLLNPGVRERRVLCARRFPAETRSDTAHGSVSLSLSNSLIFFLRLVASCYFQQNAAESSVHQRPARSLQDALPAAAVTGSWVFAALRPVSGTRYGGRLSSGRANEGASGGDCAHTPQTCPPRAHI